jgi:4-hydroxythreonine-4-phosphate dehydrogenase
VGALVREVLSLVQLSTLVIFGGDTAMGVVDALGIRSFFPVRELSQGVVVSRAELDGRDLRLVTKAGGFGAPDVLARIRDAFHKEL